MRTTLSLPREHAHRVVLFDPTLGSPAFMGRAIPIRSSGGERARGGLRAIERENALEAERHEHLLELQRELALKVKEKVITRAESRTGVVPRVLLVGTSARDVGALARVPSLEVVSVMDLAEAANWIDRAPVAVVVVDKAAFGAQELAANFPWSDPIADRMVFLSDLPAALPLTFKKPLDATDLEKVVRRPHGRLWVAPPSDDRLRCSPTIALCVHTLAGRVRRRACCLVETEEPASKPPPRSELVLDRRGDLFDHLAEIASSGLQVTRAQRLGGARSGGSTLVRLGALRRNGRRGRRRGPSRLRRARAPLVERGHQAST
jgi:hypothetical protein